MLKIRSGFSILLLGLSLVSCGVDKSKILESMKGGDACVHPIAMATNENWLEAYQVIKKVNLYDLIPHLDTLPPEADSFVEVFDSLKSQESVCANYIVLKKTTDCQAQIGYCEAYYIKK